MFALKSLRIFGFATALSAASLFAPGAFAGQLLPAGPPVIASDNVELLASLPEVGAISTAFDPKRPYMYVNTLNGISIYNISNPALPMLAGHLPMPHFENEAMSIGQRADGTTFVLVGVDIYSVTPTDTGKPAFVSGGAAEHLIVVDVTNATAPRIRSQLDTSSSTHTVQCLSIECTYAYTSGAYNAGNFHVIDLTNLDDPKEVKGLKNIAGEGHQWDLDDAGFIWSTGFDGAAGYDITDPLAPKAVASTNLDGDRAPYNDFILHNSYRPNADEFTQTPTYDEAGNVIDITSGEPDTATGNILLVTEEDYDNPVCGGSAGEGTFSTWHIPYVDAGLYAKHNPTKVKSKGKMTPLDTWNTEILNTGMPTPAGALCSAHYFTFHDAGFIAQGWYQGGTRILDVRNPKEIKQVGYFFTGDTETWHAYWVPERDATGTVTGNDTNIVYTNDVARGIDILRVTLPTTPPAETPDLTAPILPQWYATNVPTSAPTGKFGYLCRLPR